MSALTRSHVGLAGRQTASPARRVDARRRPAGARAPGTGRPATGAIRRRRATAARALGSDRQATSWRSTGRAQRPSAPRRPAHDGVDDLGHGRLEPSAASDVTGLSAMPHGTMWSNMARSGSTLRAKPCIERPRVDPHADGADLPRPAGARPGVDPDARVAASRPTPPGQAEVARASMTSCSTACTWPGRRSGPIGTVEDRVADELARAVVGDVAAPVGPDELGADRRRVDQHVARVGARTPRV